MPEPQPTDDLVVRRIRAAVRAGDERVILPHLTAPRWQIRREALEGLAKLDGEAAGDYLYRALRDRSGAVRRAAVECLGRLGDRAPALLEEGLLDDQTGGLCAAALAVSPAGRQGLAAAGELGVGRLAEALAHRDLSYSLKREVAAALAATPEGRRTLAECLGSASRSARRQAAETLLGLGEQAVELVRPMLSGPAAPWASSVLAASVSGRRELRGQAGQSLAPLVAALREPDLPIRLKVQVTKALVICEGELAGDALAEALDQSSSMLTHAAGRALAARGDRRGLPWLLSVLRMGVPPTEADLEWLGECGDAMALPVLRKLASPWRSLFLPGRLRQAAKRALERLDELLSRVPEGAISFAPTSVASQRALTLWSEEETAEEAGAEDG